MYALKREGGSTPKLAKISAVRKANYLPYCWVSCDVVYLSGGKPSIETQSSQ